MLISPPSGLVAHVDLVPSQQVFDVAQRQWIAGIEYDNQFSLFLRTVREFERVAYPVELIADIV